MAIGLHFSILMLKVPKRGNPDLRQKNDIRGMCFIIIVENLGKSREMPDLESKGSEGQACCKVSEKSGPKVP